MKRGAKIAGIFVVALTALLGGAGIAIQMLQPDRPAVRVSRPQVAMRDGVKLAIDAILPEPTPASRVPVVLYQTRYWRSFALRFPEQQGVPPVGPRGDVVDRLIAAGYGVVVADVRGTGASEGTWPRPWSEDEVADASELIAWIAAQPFCDGRIGAAGLSYEGTTALLSATTTNPALKAVLAREIEWNVVDELIAPGGVRNLSFVSAWGRSVGELDRNHPPEFFPTAARFILTGVHPVDGDADGSRLAATVAARRVADVANDVKEVRGGADWFAGVTASAVGPSAHAAALSRTRAAVGLWGGWWDGATADAVLRADRAMPLAEAVIGPWTHEGDASASPFGSHPGSTVDFDDVVAFFDRYLKGTVVSAPKRRWWVAGLGLWRDGDAWPTTTPMTLSLGSAYTLSGNLSAQEAPLDARLDVDFSATTGTNNRWMAGLLHPVDSGDRSKARGLMSFDGAMLTNPLSVFGPPVLRCQAALDGDSAALFAYLETIAADGRVRLLTEGVARIGSGPVEIRLRPIAFELPAGSALRVSFAGADADTFERVPGDGPRAITLRAPCRIQLPTVEH